MQIVVVYNTLLKTKAGVCSIFVEFFFCFMTDVHKYSYP